MLDATLTQQIEDRPLRGMRLVPENVTDVTAFLELRRQRIRRAEIGLISQHNEIFRLLAICGVLKHPWRDLAHCDLVLTPRRIDSSQAHDATKRGHQCN